ncbi:hypothetical protein [Pantoea sp. SOD02]|uniref:hypothetical protein n=1 Tax=Pantoea sp. SOD02 TaxID=2970818 RepID=UPI0012AE3CE4|nr:hypothetical protein [Pantoea sp. SOD02]MRT40573.1 hypothetical protein [Enterobacteriaceae bacterium RIT702]UVC30359.1 hypothetical protein NR302_05155 [Pantoea sp. SOD02]
MPSIIHCDIAVDEDDCEKLVRIIQGNILKIAEALAGDLQWYSQNAQLVPESFQIISIQPTNNNRFKMLYDFSWNLFNPCLDLNETFKRREEVLFQVTPGALVFEVIDNERPSPADEL